MKPVALVTGVVSDHRLEPFRELHDLEDIEVLAWDDPGPPTVDFPRRCVGELEAARAVASGRYRAVIGGLGGRVALPATYAAARRARIPFVLWASLWAHPRSAVHALSFLPLRRIYAHADAVATYGPHVTRYVEQYRDAGSIFEAPQSVSAELFGAPVEPAETGAPFTALFAGRLVPEKGVGVLAEAWRRSTLPEGSQLVAAGDGPERIDGARMLGRVPRAELPAWYAAADVLVLPSLPSRTFQEPWGLVVNEAMHQGTPVIASDAVGAAAGGLVRDSRNGFVVPAGDPEALTARLQALAASAALRERLGAAAKEDVAPYTARAWAEGVSAALRAAGGSRC